MPACCAAHSRHFRGAGGLESWRPRFSIILRRGIMKSWDCFIWTTEILPKARGCYDRSIAQRSDSIDPFYRRGVAEIELGDFAAAAPDLERAITADPAYDFYCGIGLLAHAGAQTGQPEKAARLFEQATKISTSSEKYYNYAQFLQAQGRKDEARLWVQKILDKRATMPGYQKRRERVWFRKAYAMAARLSLQ